MYAKKIKATDFRGRVYEREYLFNLNIADLVDFEAEIGGGLGECMKRLINSQDYAEIAKIFKRLILASYGEISDDGTMFIKDHPTRGLLGKEFAQTAAYNELITEFLTNPDSANEFIQGVIPSQDQIDKIDKAAASIENKPAIQVSEGQ